MFKQYGLSHMSSVETAFDKLSFVIILTVNSLLVYLAIRYSAVPVSVDVSLTPPITLSREQFLLSLMAIWLVLVMLLILIRQQQQKTWFRIFKKEGSLLLLSTVILVIIVAELLLFQTQTQQAVQSQLTLLVLAYVIYLLIWLGKLRYKMQKAK